MGTTMKQMAERTITGRWQAFAQDAEGLGELEFGTGESI